MLPRRLLPWLFALALLLGQATAFAHAIGHLHKNDAGAPEPACELCVAQSNLGSAVPATAFSLPVAPAPRLVPLARPASRVAAAPRHAQARAPPLSA
jgi:hypothetical protein